MASYLKPCQGCDNPVRSMTPWTTAPRCEPCQERHERRLAKATRVAPAKRPRR